MSEIKRIMNNIFSLVTHVANKILSCYRIIKILYSYDANIGPRE